MSYGGYEYSNQSYGGGGSTLDPMTGFMGYEQASSTHNQYGGEHESKSTDKKKVGDRQSFIRVTVRQLLSSSKVDDVYMLDGRELHTVQLVGTLNGLKLDSTNITFKLNDGSAEPLDCKQWMEKDKHSKLNDIKDGSMVRVVGNLRDYEGRKHLLVFNVSAVTDWNLLTHHLLGVILTHCEHTKGCLPAADGRSSGPTRSSATPMSFNSPMMGSRVGGTGANINFNDNSKSEGTLHKKVYDIYSKQFGDQSSQEGLHIQKLFNLLSNTGANIPMHHLRVIVNDLAEDGKIYSTIDDDHHTVTDAGGY